MIRLFVSQGINGVEAGRLAGRQNAEDDANADGKSEAQKQHPDRHYKGHAKLAGHQSGAAQPQRHAKHTAKRGQHNGFHQKLGQHIAAARAYGQPDANFARAFGYRHQHDVHDADAANQQADGRNAAQQQAHGGGGFGQRIQDVLGVAHAKIVVHGRLDPAPLAQQRLNIAFDPAAGAVLKRRNIDGANVQAAGQSPLHAFYGHQNDVIRILAARQPFLFKYAYDAAGGAINAQKRSERFLVLIHFVDHGLAQNTHGCAAQQFIFVNFPTAHHRMIAHAEIFVGGAFNVDFVIDAAVNDGLRPRRRGRNGDARNLAPHGLDIVHVKGRGRAAHAAGAAHGKAGRNKQQVGAYARDLVGNRARSRLGQVHHGNDAAHADNDAEHGQKRTHLVAGDGLRSHQQGVQGVHFRTSAGGPSASILPSTK